MTKMIARRLAVLLSLLVLTTATFAYYDPAVDKVLSGTVITNASLTKAKNAFDGNASTYFTGNNDKFQWVGLDLGQPYVITRLSYTPMPGTSGPDRCQLSLFEGANSPDFMDAMPLYLIPDKPAVSTSTAVNVNVSRGFRYVRYVGGAGSYGSIAELQFYGHAGEGDDSHFYQITNLPTLSIHVENEILPTSRGEDFTSRSVLIYENGTMVQDYPVQFRVRGNYSASPENKAYRIKFDDGKSHHMMKDSPTNESPTKAKKWVLINSWRDKTLMRNPVAWAVAKRAEMNWTPWSQVVDLVVNGDYRGTYTLADAVSVNPGRINVTDMTDWDTEGEYLTGGYFVEVDNNAGREPYWFSSSHRNPITVHDPDADVIQPVQFDYIRNTWNRMENIVFGNDYTDKEKGMRSVLDLESFLKYFLVSEYNGNTDMLCQVFFYKERGDDHFYTGPVWDAELALDDDATTYPANNRPEWTYPVRQTGDFGSFVTRVLSDPSAMTQLQEMWAKLRRKGLFEPEQVAADVDSLRYQLRSSAALNFIRWPYLNQYISLTPEIRGDWEKEVDVVRNYVRDRVAWMDNKLSYGKVRQENGIYQIGSGLDLCTFSQMVNQQGETKPKAVLTCDIDMNDYSEEFVPIGTSKNLFAGSLDGKGFTIYNMHLKGGDNVGLFGEVGACTLSNIIFDESCSVEGNNNVGMLVAYARNGSASISGVQNHGTVTAKADRAGGLVGYGRLLATLTLSTCSNTGTVTAQTNAAGLVAPAAGKITVSDSYNSGNVIGATEGKEFAFAEKSTVLNNCWDIKAMQTNNMSAGQVRNGYLTLQLNKGKETPVWRQNLDNGKTPDLWPVLRKNSGIVYDIDGCYTNSNGSGAKTYRYYNLVITKLQNGSNGTLQFSEFDILDATGSDVEDLTIYDGTEATVAHHNWPDAADNATSTKYCSGFNGYAYFLFDAGSNVVPTGYRITTANDNQRYPDRNPGSWKLYGSNQKLSDPDDASWVLLDEQVDNQTMKNVNFTPFDFPLEGVAPKGNRYFQFAIEAIREGSGVVQLSEFDLLDLNGNEVKPLSMYSTTAQGFANEEPANLVDDNLGSKYCGSFSQGNTLYIYIDAGKEVLLSGYRLTTGNDTQSSPGRNPSAWSLLGSNTRSTNPTAACWTLIDHREDDHTLTAVNYTPFDFLIDGPSPVPVPTQKPGDVNGDGKVDFADYDQLRRHLVGLPTDKINSEAADINRDGKVNAQDLVELILLFPKSTE